MTEDRLPNRLTLANSISWCSVPAGGDRMPFDQLHRREFIALVGGAAAWPLAAHAQRAVSIRRIGVLMGIPETDLSSPAFVAALRRGLQQRGWTEGQNIQIDYRWWTTGNPDELRAAAKELVDLHPDVLVAHTLNPGKALKNEIRTIPIVFCVTATVLQRAAA